MYMDTTYIVVEQIVENDPWNLINHGEFMDDANAAEILLSTIKLQRPQAKLRILILHPSHDD